MDEALHKGLPPNDIDEAGEVIGVAESADSIQAQTKEKLRDLDWANVLPFAVNLYDQIYTTDNELLSHTQTIDTKRKQLEGLETSLQYEKSNLAHLTKTIEVISSGETTLNPDLLGNYLFLHLGDFARESSEWLLASSIDQKSRGLKKSEQGDQPQLVTLTTEELEFAQRAFPAIVQKLEKKIAQLDTQVQRSSSEITASESQMKELAIKSNELKAVLKATVSVLDEREVALGAPAYIASTEPPEAQHQAFLDRISWRKEQLKQLGRDNYQTGDNILGEDWGFFVKLADQYWSLNNGNVFSPVKAMSMLTYRVPGQTYAIYAQSLSSLSHSVHIKAVLENGVVQETTYDERKSLAEPLQDRLSEFKNQATR